MRDARTSNEMLRYCGSRCARFSYSLPAAAGPVRAGRRLAAVDGDVSAGKPLFVRSVIRTTRSGPIGFGIGIRLSLERSRNEMSHMDEMYAGNRVDEHKDEAAEALQTALDRRD